MTAHTRATDPLSSHLAGEANAKHRKAVQCQTVLEAVTRRPGCTSAELAYYEGMDRYMVARRLPDLRRKGLVRQVESVDRQCEVSGRMAVRWYLAGKREQGELF